MFCPHCGTKNVEGARFCAACGAPLDMPARNAGAGQAAATGASERKRVPLLPLAVAGAAIAVAAVGAVAAWVLFFAPFKIDEATFPDEALRSYVAATADADGNGELSRDEGRAVTRLELVDVAELRGLGRFFPNLESVSVSGNALAVLDVSDLSALTSLAVRDAQLSELDVSRNAALEELIVPNTVKVTGLEGTGLHEAWAAEKIVLDAGYANAGSTETAVVNERDDAGRLLTVSMAGAVNVVSTFSYDDAGRLAEVRNDGDALTWGAQLAYDDQGRVSSMTRSRQDAGTYAYAYDDAGRLSEVTVEPTGSSGERAYAYEYDGDGRIVRYREELPGLYPSERTYAYDGDGNLVEQTYTMYTFSGAVHESRTAHHTYDDAGNLVATTYTGDGSSDLADEAYVYDDKGRVVKATRGSDVTTFVYDTNGNLAEGKSVAANGMTMDYRVAYERFFLKDGDPDPDQGYYVAPWYGDAFAPQGTASVTWYAKIPGVPYVQPFGVDCEAGFWGGF